MRIRDIIFRIRHSNTQNHSNLLISYLIKRKIFNIHRNQEDNGFGGRLPKTKYCITIFFSRLSFCQRNQSPMANRQCLLIVYRKRHIIGNIKP